MLPPLVVEALRDPHLRGAPFLVLCFLHATLELGEYRVVKHWAVAKEIGITRQRVSQSLQQLVESGYLRAGDKREHNVGSYMLLTSRGEPVQQSA